MVHTGDVLLFSEVQIMLCFLSLKHLFALPCFDSNCRGWLQRTAERGERRTAPSCHTEAHRERLKDSFTASEGILVEHPGWKYNCGTTGMVGRGRESKGIESKWWNKLERESQEVRGVANRYIFGLAALRFISEGEKARQVHISSETHRIGCIHQSSREVELIFISFLIRIEVQLYYQAVEGWRSLAFID